METNNGNNIVDKTVNVVLDIIARYDSSYGGIDPEYIQKRGEYVLSLFSDVKCKENS